MTFNHKIKTLSVLLSFALFFTAANAQEVLTGLRVNKAITREAAKHTPSQPTRADGLHLPFVDDFSNYTGYPNPALWQDRYAFVNRSFAIQPPTLGVATLDALDENGNVYSHADAAGFKADQLTSLPIRLDYNFTLHREMRVSDSLYFSFYYQPAGGSLAGVEWERLGNRPEGRDSLILEFGYATGNTIFIGYEYCDYYLGENESYVIGDTLFNPFLPSDFYIFDHAAFPGDHLLLPCNELYGPEIYWEHIWNAPGELLDSWIAENPLQYFKQVMIPITDPKWFVNNFQFRFRNLASLEDNSIVGWASNVDQWNIDYVRLDVNRSQDDLYPNDLAFVMPTTSILKHYQAMPWSQYRDSDLAGSFDNKMANLSKNVKTATIRTASGKWVGDRWQATSPITRMHAPITTTVCTMCQPIRLRLSPSPLFRGTLLTVHPSSSPTYSRRWAWVMTVSATTPASLSRNSGTTMHTMTVQPRPATASFRR